MAKKFYCYEGGACRGDEFTNKIIFPDTAKLIATMEEGIALKLDDEDKYDDFIESIYDDNDDYATGCALVGMITGGDCCEPDHTAAERVQMIKDGKSFSIVLEESELGFGPTKQDAKLAFVAVAEEGEGW